MIVHTNLSFSLNYLIYMQNIFLNYQHGNEENFNPVFPFCNTSCNNPLNTENFKEKWGNSLEVLINKRINSQFEPLLENLHDSIFINLFKNDDERDKYLLESYKSFLAWWEPDGFGAQLLLEMFLEKIDLYTEIQKIIKEHQVSVTHDKLKIDVIYDDIVLTSPILKLGYVIVSYKELFHFKLTNSLSEKVTNQIMYALN
nr:hypothetical protein [Aneurinibacillus terranovensis]